MRQADTSAGERADAERQRLEEALRENEALRLFVEHTPAAVAMFDRDMRYLMASRRFLRDWRVSYQDVIGRSHYDVFPDCPERWKEVHRRCLAGAVERCEEDPFPRGDGTLDWVRWEIYPWHTTAGKIGGIILFSENITERKRGIEALRESEERFRLLVQGVKDHAIYMLAPDGTVQSWSAAAEQMFGYREEEIVGRHRAVIFTEEQRSAGDAERDLEKAVQEGRYEEEDWRVRKDGSRLWANVVLTALRDDAGNLRGFANVTRDFTDRKRSEAALRESEARLSALVKASSDVVYRMSPDWSEMRELLGREFIANTEVPTSSWLDKYIHPDDQPHVMAVINEAIRTKSAFQLEHRVLRVDGSLGWTFSRAIPILDANGNIAEWFGAASDITERKRGEAALRESEQRLRLAHEAARVGAFEWDIQTGVNTWTPQLEAMHGLPRGGFAGTEDAWEKLIHPDDRDATVRRVAQAFETGAPTEGEWRVVWPDGSIHWIAGRWQVFKDHACKPLRMSGINIDVTERKLTEERLAYLASFPENNPNPVAELGLDGTVTYANPAALRLFPDLPGEGGAHPWLSGWATMAASMREGSATRERVLTVGDRTFHQVFTHLPGQRARIYSTDISERLHAEHALRAKEAELEVILDRTPFMLTRCSRDLRYRYVSRAYADLLGRTPDEIAGKSIVEVIGEKALQTIRPHVEAVLRGKVVEFEDEVHYSGVGARVMHAIYVPDADEQGQVIGWVANIVDVTEQKQAEALRVANAALLEADRNRTEFLAVLSHELRNPLAPIRNSLYLLERAAPGGEQAKRAQAVIDRQVGHMTRLTDDLLDVTRIVRGKVRLQREGLDLNEVVQRTVDDHRTLFFKGDVRLEVLQAPAELRVHGDRTRLAQVIGNLLQNAAKFTPRGGTATVSIQADPARGQAVLTVRDTGVGIEPAMLPRLFHAFTQGDATLDRSKGGLGLGLALVKGLVELHGGSVVADSRGAGKGSAFTIRLPVDATDARAAARRRDLSLARPSRRVLVIEDNDDAAETLREVLELDGHVVEVAYTGIKGVEKARAFHPDVVLCDIGLPGMDGYEVARTLRADPELARVTLVAVTGYAQPEDVAMAKEAGFDAHLAKPPSIETLERVMADGKLVPEGWIGAR